MTACTSGTPGWADTCTGRRGGTGRRDGPPAGNEALWESEKGDPLGDGLVVDSSLIKSRCSTRVVYCSVLCIVLCCVLYCAGRQYHACGVSSTHTH